MYACSDGHDFMVVMPTVRHCRVPGIVWPSYSHPRLEPNPMFTRAQTRMLLNSLHNPPTNPPFETPSFFLYLALELNNQIGAPYCRLNRDQLGANEERHQVEETIMKFLGEPQDARGNSCNTA